MKLSFLKDKIIIKIKCSHYFLNMHSIFYIRNEVKGAFSVQNVYMLPDYHQYPLIEIRFKFSN